MEEINDYLMKGLYQDFFAVEMPSVSEYNLQLKIEEMKDLEPGDFGISDEVGANSPEMKFAWKAAIREL